LIIVSRILHRLMTQFSSQRSHQMNQSWYKNKMAFCREKQALKNANILRRKMFYI